MSKPMPSAGQIWLLEGDLILLMDNGNDLRNVLLYDSEDNASPHLGFYRNEDLRLVLIMDGRYIGDIECLTLPLMEAIKINE